MTMKSLKKPVSKVKSEKKEKKKKEEAEAEEEEEEKEEKDVIVDKEEVTVEEENVDKKENEEKIEENEKKKRNKEEYEEENEKKKEEEDEEEEEEEEEAEKEEEEEEDDEEEEEEEEEISAEMARCKELLKGNENQKPRESVFKFATDEPRSIEFYKERIKMLKEKAAKNKEKTLEKRDTIVNVISLKSEHNTSNIPAEGSSCVGGDKDHKSNDRSFLIVNNLSYNHFPYDPEGIKFPEPYPPLSDYIVYEDLRFQPEFPFPNNLRSIENAQCRCYKKDDATKEQKRFDWLIEKKLASIRMSKQQASCETIDVDTPPNNKLISSTTYSKSGNSTAKQNVYNSTLSAMTAKSQPLT